MLGELVNQERLRHGFSLREAARRTGVSAAYLDQIERGRNPTTGRAPIPSPTVLRGIERALEIDMATLLDLASGARPPSTHALLFQLGQSRRPSHAAAASAARATVDTWIEIAGRPPGEAVRAAAAHLRAGATTRAVVGLIFGGGGAGLRAGAAEIVAAERTWEDDVAAACRAAAGVEPVANVCVYREADVRDVTDPVAFVLDLIRAHPHVAAQDPDGRVTTGPGAVHAILAVVRPAGIGPGAWASLSSAAAAGLHREAVGV